MEKTGLLSTEMVDLSLTANLLNLEIFSTEKI